jgi:hypothetical protein
MPQQFHRDVERIEVNVQHRGTVAHMFESLADAIGIDDSALSQTANVLQPDERNCRRAGSKDDAIT